jgi:hypothetical protein
VFWLERMQRKKLLKKKAHMFHIIRKADWLVFILKNYYRCVSFSFKKQIFFFILLKRLNHHFHLCKFTIFLF